MIYPSLISKLKWSNATSSLYRFTRFSIFTMSITPYITASIVIQLLAMIIPALERLTKEGGEEGRKKINKYTKEQNKESET